LQFNFLIVLLIILSAVLPFLFFAFFNKKNQYFTSRYQENFALYSSKLSDLVDSLKEIKLFDIYQKETDKFNLTAQNLILINIKKLFWGFTSGQFSVALQHVVLGILLGFLGYQTQQKVVTLGQAIFIYNISDNLFHVISDFWSFYFFTRNSKVPWKRIKKILVRESENKNFTNGAASSELKKINNIIFQNVSVKKIIKSYLKI
jgi:ABC-type bacteriocin/lantibiotic exporter with double-glycine peptidase domain